MATLLNGVNEVLKRVSVLEGDTGALASLSDSSKQVWIDLAVQIWNEIIDELYRRARMSRPNAYSTSSITLVADDRDYALAADLVRLKWPLKDETNGLWIEHYPGGYDQLYKDQLIPANYTGLPNLAAIKPTSGELYLNTVPSANEAGRVYSYLYEKDTVLSLAADTFPFPNDKVYRALVPVVAEVWKLERQNEFNGGWSKVNMGRAQEYLTEKTPVKSWHRNEHSQTVIVDPYHG